MDKKRKLTFIFSYLLLISLPAYPTYDEEIDHFIHSMTRNIKTANILCETYTLSSDSTKKNKTMDESNFRISFYSNMKIDSLVYTPTPYVYILRKYDENGNIIKKKETGEYTHKEQWIKQNDTLFKSSFRTQTYEVYDEKWNLKESTTINHLGKITHKILIETDEEKKTSKHFYYDYNGAVYFRTIETSDFENNPLEYIEYGKNDSFISSNQYIYEAKGKLLQINRTNGGTITIESFQYDNKNRETNHAIIQLENGENALISEEITEYNTDGSYKTKRLGSNGEVISETCFNTQQQEIYSTNYMNGIKVYENIHQYDKNGNEIQNDIYRKKVSDFLEIESTDTLSTVFTYNKEQLLAEKNIYRNNLFLEGYSYRYDKNKRIISEEQINDVEHIITQYEYDEWGNCIREKRQEKRKQEDTKVTLYLFQYTYNTSIEEN